MNKEAFNQLEIKQQVEYINGELKNNSLNSVCEVIGISEATVRDRFKRKGYARQGKQFIYTGIAPANKPAKVKTNINNTDATVNTKKITNTKEQQKSNKSSDIKTLEKKIESLEAQIKGIMEMINTTNIRNTNNTINTKELKKYKGTTVSRNYRVNEEVQKEFKKICNKFTAGTDYTVTDIISLALEEFINKHN
ncbi:hypothetical protein [Escherichia coli]|uniref:hypothetical protein n=1 Tax=Escherichia coli TaxID=562 RepID=UPI00293BF6EB|nr:hypothetical protein [Escherichia coli]